MNYLSNFLLMVMVLGIVVVAAKPSPIYAGLGLIVSGGAGCGVVLYYGCSYMGLMVCLIYLGGMLVVFGYTTALATEEYPEMWSSNSWMWFLLFSGIVLEIILIVLFMESDGLKYLSSFVVGLDLLGVEGEEILVVREDSIGVGSMYNLGNWLLIISGWSLLVGGFIIIEITRGV